MGQGFHTVHDIAEEIAVRAGVLLRCPLCEEVFDPLAQKKLAAPIEAAYRLASAMIRDGHPLVRWDCDRRSLLDEIKAVCEDCHWDCQCMRRSYRDD